MSAPAALTIAGSDSGGGAGIQADLKTFAAFGVHGTSAITAITAQNTWGVISVEPVSTDMVTAQLAALAADIRIDAAKTGMLATAAIVDAVADALVRHRFPHVVVDPVLRATSGRSLLDGAGVPALISRLLPLATVVTPNIAEAEALSGRAIQTRDERRDAAKAISALGARAVIITGGHLDTPDITDLLYDGRTFTEFRTPRVAGRGTHGTGCTFSAALTALLALGRPLLQAVPEAQAYVGGAIRAGLEIGTGKCGPMDHTWRWRAEGRS